MIGAGILALPTVTEPVGFVPSSVALIGVWGYMVASALLITGTSRFDALVSQPQLTSAMSVDAQR